MSIYNKHFYNQTLRKYIVMFGAMFDNMYVQRLDAAGTTVQTIGVPITYAPKEKYLSRLTQDPNLTRPIAIQLPSLSFEISSMSYDGSRRLNHTQLNKAYGSSQGHLSSQYVPVPWNIYFELYIYVKNADDAAQILEQILPFFGPEWTNSVRLVPSMGITMDVPTILNSVSMEDTYQGNFENRRALIYTLSFTVKGFFFGPVRTGGSRSKVIKRVQLDFSVPAANNNISIDEITNYELSVSGRNDRVIITPGLLANGSPTTNSAASINYQLISANTNYGIASNTYFYTDGLKYDPQTGDDI